MKGGKTGGMGNMVGENLQVMCSLEGMDNMMNALWHASNFLLDTYT